MKKMKTSISSMDMWIMFILNEIGTTACELCSSLRKPIIDDEDDHDDDHPDDKPEQDAHDDIVSKSIMDKEESPIMDIYDFNIHDIMNNNNVI